MKKKEFIQIKGLETKELQVKAQALRSEIADLTLDKNMKKLKDLKMVSKKRKELARILTVAREKELLIQLESQVQTDSENSDDASDTPDAKKGTKK